MFIEIPDLLTAAQTKQLRDIAKAARFVDGRISNPHNETKKNLQLDQDDKAYLDSSKILAEALLANEGVKNFAFINRFAPPLICRYQPDMAYGKHADNAFVQVQNTMIRSDISCTIFLEHPEAYEGGELTIHLGDKTVSVKGKAGSAVLYPSTTIHEVMPVTKGERVVAITFIESQIIDEHKRNLLYTLNEVAALEGYNISWDNRVQLQHVSASLHRMWST
jgi:PKHD-type hydroxylase